jgi:hypothetical protein
MVIEDLIFVEWRLWDVDSFEWKEEKMNCWRMDALYLQNTLHIFLTPYYIDKDADELSMIIQFLDDMK